MPLARLASRIFILSLTLLSCLAGAAEGPDRKSAPDPPIAPGIQRERVSLVLVDVVVTDRRGHFVGDLRPDEFTLMVDGGAVPIQVDLQSAGESEPGTVAPSDSGGMPPQDERSAHLIRRSRGFVLFFDGLNGVRGLGPEPIQSARRFLQGGLQEGDEVMVVGLGRSLKTYQDFTPHVSEALTALDQVEKDPQLRIGGAAMFARGGPERLGYFITCLETLVGSLRARDGRKEVFLFSDGIPSNPDPFKDPPFSSGVESAFLRVAREAAAAQAVLNAVNTRGMPVWPGEIKLEKMTTRTLAILALNSGGVLTHGVNHGFEEPMRRIEREARATYLLSYAPQGEPDGKLHSIRVLVRRQGVQVRAQEGYVWMTENQRRERETLAAYFMPEHFRKIPVALQARSYLAAGGQPSVELALALPDSSLLFLPREGHLVAHLEAGFVLKSEDESVKDRFSRGVEVRLPSEALDHAGDLTFLARRAVAAGEYEAIAVVRDLDSGDVGALRTPVTVPAFSSDHLAMSSLVLSSPVSADRRIDLDPPDSQERPQAVPAVTRIFTRSDDITGSFTLYHPLRDPATGEARVTVRCRIRRGTETVREFAPRQHLLRAGDGPAAVPLEVSVDLSDLAPGLYDLQVEAWDEVDRRGVLQRVDFLMR